MDRKSILLSSLLNRTIHQRILFGSVRDTIKTEDKVLILRTYTNLVRRKAGVERITELPKKWYILPSDKTYIHSICILHPIYKLKKVEQHTKQTWGWRLTSFINIVSRTELVFNVYAYHSATPRITMRPHSILGEWVHLKITLLSLLSGNIWRVVTSQPHDYIWNIYYTYRNASA